MVLPSVLPSTALHPESYSAGHLLRNRTARSGWISYLRKGVFHVNLQYNGKRLSYFPNNQPGFLITLFLIRCPVLTTQNAVR